MEESSQSFLSRFMKRFHSQHAKRLARELEPLQLQLDEITTALEEARKGAGKWPPGHFYSPIPSESDVRVGIASATGRDQFGGIDWRDDAAKRLLEELAAVYPRLKFDEPQGPDARFNVRNPSYGHYDAVLLACMILRFKPARIIEVGSGFSSALMIDTNERFFDGGIQLTMIEPHPETLFSCMRREDKGRVRVIEHKVQDAPMSLYRELEENDILFIDSSHVSKIGSDVNHLFFEVLPLLKPGVLVHIHDITGNWEYPPEWFLEGRTWNELYLLRAFLMFNDSFEILLNSVRLREKNPDLIAKRMPLCTEGGGGQLWIRRTR